MSKLPPERPPEPELSSEDFPAENVTMTGIGPDDPNGIRARLRTLCLKAEVGDEDAIEELFDLALRLSAEIDFDAEMSLVGIVLASLLTPIKYLRCNEKARLASFGVTRDPNRPPSSRTQESHIRIAQDIGSNWAVGYSLNEAIGKAAEDNKVSERTAQRVNKEFPLIVKAIKIVVERKERKFRK